MKSKGTRTSIAIKGIIISIIFVILQGILSLWRTRVIIFNFGVDSNSIIQIAGQIFAYLMLLEGGVTAAYLFNMYSYKANNEKQKIGAIINVLKLKLKRIAVVMISVIIIISFIYPHFINSNEMSHFETTIIFIMLGIRFVIPYYFTLADKTLLVLNEKQYVVIMIEGFVQSIIILFEVFLILFLGLSLLYILMIGIILTYISKFLYSLIISSRYHDFKTNERLEPENANKMTNDIIVHQVASIANSHIDTIILSFVDLFSVTVYTAITTLITYPVVLMNKIVSTIRASIGIKFNSKDKNNFNVFSELLVINFFISSVITSTFIIMSNKFIILWIGERFTISFIDLVLFSLILFHRLIISSILIVRDGNGLYKESKSFTILASLVNLVLSIVLVFPFGVTGLLVATVFSTYFIMDFGNFYLVYKKVFMKKNTIYYHLFYVFLSIVLSVIIANIAISSFGYHKDIIFNFLIEVFISIFTTSVIISILLMIFNKNNFISVICRFSSSLVHYLKRKKNKRRNNK